MILNVKIISFYFPHISSGNKTTNINVETVKFITTLYGWPNGWRCHFFNITTSEESCWLCNGKVGIL